MAIYNKLVFVFLLCYINHITCDLKAIQEEISELIGEKQYKLMSYLMNLKLAVEGKEHKLSIDSFEYEKSISDEIDKITESINLDLSGIKPEQKQCADDLLCEMENIQKAADEIIQKCVTSVKPSLVSLFGAIARHGEFRTKIGSVPSKCIKSNDDPEAIIHCIKEALDDIQLEMDGSKKTINFQMDTIFNNIEKFSNEVPQCKAVNIGKQKLRAKEAAQNFEDCMHL